MGKHNGKARRSGQKVGEALLSRKAKEKMQPRGVEQGQTGTVQQSVWEQSDLTELINMADLANRDFTALKSDVVLIAPESSESKQAQAAAQQRRLAQLKHASQLRLPRRPAWTASTSAQQLDAQEKSAFLNWRRKLARLEEQENLVLTPFEKNLNVWRQLWRVVERSDIVVQVVDARQPLFYWSNDLTNYARELSKYKASFMLLNKSDLIPVESRRIWAKHLDGLGIRHVFWSASACGQASASDDEDAECQEGVEDAVRVLNEQELMVLFKQWAVDARQGLYAAGESSDDVGSSCTGSADGYNSDVSSEGEVSSGESAEQGARGQSSGDAMQNNGHNAHGGPRSAPQRDDASQARERGAASHVTIGLIGYPNVGKSSTINALYGAKKTAVAATPGKTKHFQTLFVDKDLCLCDCPGMVLPQFAHSKAQLVTAGVLPIDRLTDVKAAIAAVCARLPKLYLEQYYNLIIPDPGRDVATSLAARRAGVGAKYADPTMLIAVLARSRNWLTSASQPDWTRTSRLVLKDYVGGKLTWHDLPDGSAGEWRVGAEHVPRTHEGACTQHTGGAVQPAGTQAGASQGDSSVHEADVQQQIGRMMLNERGEDGVVDCQSSVSQSVANGGQNKAGTGVGVQQRDPAPVGCQTQQASVVTIDSAGQQEASSTVAVTQGVEQEVAQYHELPARDGEGAVVDTQQVDQLTVDEADVDLMDTLGLFNKQAKKQRPDYKFNKKAPKSRKGAGQGGYQMYTVKAGNNKPLTLGQQQ